MKPIVTKIKDEKFIKEIVPDLIYNAIIDRLTNNQYKDSVEKMDTYIKEYYGISIKVLCLSIKQYLTISSNSQSAYSIALNENKLVDNTSYSVGFIVRIIDYGSMDIKGLDLFKSSFDYVEKNLDSIYKLYLKGGMSNVHRVI